MIKLGSRLEKSKLLPSTVIIFLFLCVDVDQIGLNNDLIQNFNGEKKFENDHEIMISLWDRVFGCFQENSHFY